MRLSSDQVRAESGASVGEIERFVAAGIATPSPDGTYSWADLQRIRAVKQFLDAGVPWEHMHRALEEKLITFAYTEAFYLEPSPPTGWTYGQFERSLGPDADRLSRVYDTLGLVEPPAERPMRRDEAECLAQLVRLWAQIGGEEAVLRAARLLGDHVRAAVDGWMALWTEHLQGLAADATSSAERTEVSLELGRGLADLLPRLMVWAEQRYLEQAMTAAGIAQIEETLAAHGIAPAPAEHPPAVLFVDLVGFTRLTEEQGDEAAVALGGRLRDVTERAARRHGGRLVKLLGDGAMLHFRRADEAVAASIDLLSHDGWHEGLPEPHIGLHAGPLIERDGDLFGTTVNLAARLSAAAGPGELVASAEAVSGLGGAQGITLQPMGELSLRNVARPVAAFRIRPG